MRLGVLRSLLLAAAVACSRPAEAPAQLDGSTTSFAKSKDAAVRSAAAMVESGRPWRATEILDSAYRSAPTRSAEVVLLSALAAADWGGWDRVDRELTTVPWLDSLFEGRGRELLARSALARSADSVAAVHAERAIGESRTERDRGVREVLLARALDRRALGDSAADVYLRAARRLPSVADWLELRAAGATSDAAQRQRNYGRVGTAVARARIAPTEAQARERWRDFAGAAKAYADMGEKAQALRLELLAKPDSATRASVRARALALLAGRPSANDARLAITLLDSSSLSPLSATENLAVARAASSAGLLPRAAAGFARADREMDAPDRYAYATVLSRLGRDVDAAGQFARVPASSPQAAVAAYQRARSLLRAGQTPTARTALRQVTETFPRDTSVVAPALFLLADLATDDGRDSDARAGFNAVATRFPTSGLAPAALFRAATISYVAGGFDVAAREFDRLVERYPRSTDASAARYWAGRARERVGDRKRASAHWREVMATDPLSYYALASARRLGIAPWKLPSPTDSTKRFPALRQAADRAELLDVLGMGTEEGFEYDALGTAGATPDSIVGAAEVLMDHGETPRAIGLARRALAASARRDTRLFRLLYPLVYGDAIRAEAAARQVDPTLVAALIHQESGFNPRATSRAGAVGLMQVLPSVGASIARAQGLSSYERVLLYQPDVNLRLGMAHLDAMLRQYPRVEYALAAYNAGGVPVRRWRQKPGTDDPELFVERIPYDETRDYVRILLRNQAMYRTLYAWPAASR
jgi:soluble lytic murein transglycosylase